jgi:hypothetical protein
LVKAWPHVKDVIENPRNVAFILDSDEAAGGL